MPLPHINEIRELVSYDGETGKFMWKLRPGKEFWNARFAGKQVRSDSGRYCRLVINGEYYFAHRVAWLLITGEEPLEEIDHINGDTRDNRQCNLRSVTASTNKRNLPLKADNTSGVCGVYRVRRNGRWCAQIRNADGKLVHLGLFESIQDAAIARKNAERDFGYHENHGRAPEIKQRSE